MLKLLDSFKVYIFFALLCVIAVGGLASYLSITHLSDKLDDANETIVSLRAENTALTTANTAMAADIDTQNAAVKGLKTAQEEASKTAAAELKKVINERDKWRDRYAVLFGGQSTSDTLCEDIVKLVTGYYELRKEEAGK